MRPRIHFTAQSGWINDPHGITYRDGEYHSFYQYVPGQTVWGPNCHWGHAVGPDLLSLTELPVAIAPGDGDDGIWTGSLVTDDDGAATILYTSTAKPNIGIGRIRVATPEDEAWISWRKGDFVAEAPEELDIIAYRDPFVRQEGDRWRMFVGAGLRDGTAAALTYTSEDLRSWSYEGIALQRHTSVKDDVWMGALWECPQMFDLHGRAVMISSVWDDDILHYAGYAIGEYEGGRFVADSWGRLTHGDSYYAPSLFLDAEGRPCLSFWMRGMGGPEDGWASAHSVPYLLAVDDGHLTARPNEDVNQHRSALSDDGTTPHPVADIEWDTVSGGSLELTVGGTLAASLTREGDTLRITIGEATTTIPTGNGIRVLVDGPVLEVSTGLALFGAQIDVEDAQLAATANAGEWRVYPLA